MNRRQFLQAAGGLTVAGSSHAAWHYWPEAGCINPCLLEMPPRNSYTLIANRWLASEHKPVLLGLKQANALLYDFAFKRLPTINGLTFSANIFETRSLFERHA